MPVCYVGFAMLRSLSLSIFNCNCFLVYTGGIFLLNALSFLLMVGRLLLTSHVLV